MDRGSTSRPTRSVTFKNSSEVEVYVTVSSKTGSYFSLSSSSLTVPAKGSSSFTVTLINTDSTKSSVSDTFSYTVSYSSGNITSSSFTATVRLTDPSGRLTLNTYTANLGSLSLDYSADKAKDAAKEIKVTNDGSATVRLTTIKTSNNFTFSAFKETTLAAGESTTFTVTPKTGLKAGSYEEEITITTQEKVSAYLTVKLSVGKEYDISADPGTVSFGTMQANSIGSESKTVKITNTGRLSLTLKRPSTANFQVSGFSAGDVLKTGESVTMTIRPYEGLSAGTHRETLTIDTNEGVNVKVDASVNVTAMTIKIMAFQDVPKGEWFYDSVSYVYSHNLMSGSGDNTFSPNAKTTRGMIVTILHQLAGKPVGSAAPFQDTPVGEWFTPAARWAAGSGLVSGYGDGRFGPNDTITREQLALILYNYARSKGYDTSKRSGLSIYADEFQVSSYAVTALEWATAEGLISGTGSGLAPQGSATRAQVAVILTQFCKNVVK